MVYLFWKYWGRILFLRRGTLNKKEVDSTFELNLKLVSTVGDTLHCDTPRILKWHLSHPLIVGKMENKRFFKFINEKLFIYLLAILNDLFIDNVSFLFAFKYFLIKVSKNYIGTLWIFIANWSSWEKRFCKKLI